MYFVRNSVFSILHIFYPHVFQWYCRITFGWNLNQEALAFTCRCRFTCRWSFSSSEGVVSEDRVYILPGGNWLTCWKIMKRAKRWLHCLWIFKHIHGPKYIQYGAPKCQTCAAISTCRPIPPACLSWYAKNSGNQISRSFQIIWWTGFQFLIIDIHIFACPFSQFYNKYFNI